MEELVQYRPEELERFLREVDRQLSAPVEIIIIGGAVISMRYSQEHTTTDIDLWTNPAKEFWEAVRRVNELIGLTVPVKPAHVAEPPYGFEDRLQPYTFEGLTHLKIWIPERHDLVLMKTARGETPDFEGIVEVHQKEPLDPELLLRRCLQEMRTQITGTWSGFRVKFLGMIEEVFGKATEKDIAKRFPTE